MHWRFRFLLCNTLFVKTGSSVRCERLFILIVLLSKSVTSKSELLSEYDTFDAVRNFAREVLVDS